MAKIVSDKIGVQKDYNSAKKNGFVPIFLFDTSILKKVFEQEDDGKIFLNELEDVNNESGEKCGFATSAGILNTIYYGNTKKLDFKVIRKFLRIVNILPSFCNFRDTKATINELIDIANTFTKQGKNNEKENIKGYG